MKLALYQGSGYVLDVPKNLELLTQMVEKAAIQDADLLIFPELFLSGYNIGDRMWQVAQSADSPILKQIADTARDHQLAILVGYPEREGDRLYNSAILMDAAGEPVANYRKMHLFGPEEQRLFQEGTEWVMHPIAGLQVGILICYDVEFPEAVRSLALQGADLIAVPTALMAPYTHIPQLVVPTRALENQIFVAYVNRVGHEADLTYCGLSCVVGPEGGDRVRADSQEALLIVEIQRDELQQERSTYCYLQDRRTKQYWL